MNSKILFLVASCLLASALPSAQGLSWPLCEEGGSVWVTERPTTGEEFPGANLWLFCNEGINILGKSVDVCINNGTVCTAQVAKAICHLIGYDTAHAEEFTSEPAARNETVISLTGEFCLRKGVYAEEAPSIEELAALPGEPCDKISAITCSRSIDTMEVELALGIESIEDLVVDPAPAAETLNETLAMAKKSAAEVNETAPGAAAGRRLLAYL